MAGIQDIPLNIPGEWDATWFRRFVQDVLSKLDTRNAVGDGIDISSTGNSVATLTNAITEQFVTDSVDTGIAAHEALPDPHPVYLTQTEGDARYESTDSILAPTTFVGLPTAVGKQGVRATVTDATATTFASVVAGGGSNIVPCYSDGTDWRIG